MRKHQSDSPGSQHVSLDDSQGEEAGPVWGVFQEEEAAGGQAARQKDCLEGQKGMGGSPLLTHSNVSAHARMWAIPSSALMCAVPSCLAWPSLHLSVRFLFSDEYAPAGLHSCNGYCILGAAVSGTVIHFLAVHPFEPWGTQTVLHISSLTPHHLI